MLKTAMILAAGRGERMRPLTDDLPKPLIPLLGKPLLVYHIEKLATAGIRNIVINHAWLGEKIEAELGNGSQFNVQICYSREEQALETAGGIINALPLLGDETFLVVNGDVYCDVNFWRLCSEPFRGLAKLLMVDNPQHNPKGDFSIQDGRLRDKSISESSYTFSGIGLYHPDFFAGLKVSKQPLAPLIRNHLVDDKVAAQHYPGCWSDVGTPERLADLEKELSL